jgi:uncharacterized membrane protein YdbT with pleckstrin-like domain
MREFIEQMADDLLALFRSSTGSMNADEWQSKAEWQEEQRHESEEHQKEEAANHERERERKAEQRRQRESALLVKAVAITASIAALLGIIVPRSLYIILFVIAWAIVTYPFRRLKSFWIRCVLYVIAPVVVLAAAISIKDRYEAQKLDHEVKWRSFKDVLQLCSLAEGRGR